MTRWAPRKLGVEKWLMNVVTTAAHNSYSMITGQHSQWTAADSRAFDRKGQKQISVLKPLPFVIVTEARMDWSCTKSTTGVTICG